MCVRGPWQTARTESSPGAEFVLTNQIGRVLPGSRSSEAPFVFCHTVVAHANRGQRDGEGKTNLTSDLDTRYLSGTLAWPVG